MDLLDERGRLVAWVHPSGGWGLAVSGTHGQAATLDDAKAAVEAEVWACTAEGLVRP